MTSDMSGSDEILSPLAGLKWYLDPYPTLAPRKEKAWGFRHGGCSTDGAKIVPALRASDRK
jgi:hypothetical protein